MQMDDGNEYASVALDEKDDGMFLGQNTTPYSRRNDQVIWLVVFVVTAVVFFVGGYGMSEYMRNSSIQIRPGKNGLLPAQSFIPDIPTQEVVFEFPTDYGDDGIFGDKLWKEMMPIGAGFVRVPNPRQYDMPASKPMLDDPEDAEIYSISMTHQLHCLAVLRHVIREYAKGNKSRFAGAGHEYHCLDYIRQSILCAGDTTLDYAEMSDGYGLAGSGGFSGAGSKHQCRDWNAIRDFMIENRSGDKEGILA